MPRLNYQQVAQLAWEAGWRGKDAETAVAIARAESQFDTLATNFKNKDHSFGLWQVNMKDALGPDRRKRYNLSSNEQLFDARTNARVAFAIYKDAGNKFGDWSTYNNRSYTLYLNGAVFAIKQIQQGKTGLDIPSYDSKDVPPGQDTTAEKGIIPDPLQGVKDVADAVGSIGAFLTNQENWFRAAAVVGGGVLIVLAVFLVMTDTVVGVALKKVGKVIPK
jgi:hypothetical protein